MGRLYDDEDYETENLLKEISDNLGKQISNELNRDNISYNRNIQSNRATVQREQMEDLVRRNNYPTVESLLSASNNGGAENTIKGSNKKPSSEKKKIFVAVGAMLVGLLLLVVLLGNYVLDQLNYEDGSIILDEEGNEIQVEDFVPSDKNVDYI